MPWWIPLIQGIALLIVGILLFTSPIRTTLFIVQVLALYWFLSGIFEIVSIFLDRTAWGWKLLGGIIGILAGYYILSQPVAGALVLGFTLVVVLGIQALIMGIVNVIQALRGAGWGIGVLGIINILFGVILLGNTLIATATLPWVIGAFAIVGGISAIFMAFRLRSN
ncbi:HdeD family acid-resistance protein [Promineifilum sp.]|uniref:HdeD family acid-resistance protein n=1 Tax=Promineifilum sp. TaxID=2664178 RepID=UPI0035B46714